MEANLLLQEKSLNYHEIFEVGLLKANILLALRKIKESLEHFQRLESSYPKLAIEAKLE